MDQTMGCNPLLHRRIGEVPGPQRLRRRTFVLGLAGLWLTGCVTRADPRYSVVMDRPRNRVTVAHSAAGVTVNVTSQSGIGRMQFAWWTPSPPAVTAIHLALTGLEHVALQWEDKTVSTAWRGTASPWATLGTADGENIDLSSDDIDWPVLTHPTDGAFVLVPPESFQTAAPVVWRLEWIDYYR